MFAEGSTEEPTTKKFLLFIRLVLENGKREVVAVECSFDFISREQRKFG